MILLNRDMGDKGLDIFDKGSSTKLNVIARLQFELTYCDAAVKLVSHKRTNIYISSSCHSTSTDIPDPLSLLLLIIHRFRQVFRLHPVSSHSCCMYVRAGRPAFAWPYAGVHRSTSLMSSSLLLQQCPACLARLTCIVFVMGGKWP